MNTIAIPSKEVEQTAKTLLEQKSIHTMNLDELEILTQDEKIAQI